MIQDKCYNRDKDKEMKEEGISTMAKKNITRDKILVLGL